MEEYTKNIRRGAPGVDSGLVRILSCAQELLKRLSMGFAAFGLMDKLFNKEDMK